MTPSRSKRLLFRTGFLSLSGPQWHGWIESDVDRPHAVRVWWASRIAGPAMLVPFVLILDVVFGMLGTRSVLFVIGCVVAALATYAYFSRRVWPEVRAGVHEQLSRGEPTVTATVRLRV